MQEKEYESKWQYVIHTENIQAKYIQWYITVCAAVFLFIYSSEVTVEVSIVKERWFALAVLALYSILTCLRLLSQKRNYDTYTARLRELDGTASGNHSTRKKVFSIFKLQYYVICLVGVLVFLALSNELNIGFNSSIAIGLIYGVAAIGLSFTRLIGE